MRGEPNVVTTPERRAAELIDVALPVVLRHHVRGNSVEVELAVGRAVERVLRSSAGRGPDELADRVADGVYQAALRRGLTESFLDLRLDLWHALRQAVA